MYNNMSWGLFRINFFGSYPNQLITMQRYVKKMNYANLLLCKSLYIRMLLKYVFDKYIF